MIKGIFSGCLDQAYFLMRVFAGLLFAAHGAQKLFGVLGATRATFGADRLMFIAGVIEFFGGLAIAVGVLAHLVAFLAAGEMAVAYLYAHLPQGFWPIQNGGELALLYMFVFLFIMTRGAGKWSLDSRLERG